METARQKTASAAPVVTPAAAPNTAQRSTAPGKGALQLQSMKISSPHDPAEKEAGSITRKVMSMAVPEGSIAHPPSGSGGMFVTSPYVRRFATSGIPAKHESEKLQRKVEGPANLRSNVAADMEKSSASGSPLPLSVRRFMEPRFNANFSNVKIHTGESAGTLARQFSAQAFTVGNQIFFGKDRFKPETQEGKELIAHELTHTIQQGAAIQRSEESRVTERSSPQVQRLGISDALDYFADKAYHIPGFRMLTIVMGFNPINMRSTDRSAANLLRALIELAPGGHLITQVLDTHGVFNKAGAWIEQKLATLGDIGGDIVSGLKRFIDSLSWTDIFDLGGVWDRAKRIFTEPIGRLISFAGTVVSEILKMVKDAMLKPLAALAQGTRGYDLLKAMLGEDPITGEPVPRTADTLIGGFMKLIGQEEIWQNLKKGNAVGRAWAWFQGALAGLMGFARTIPRRIVATITSLTFQDIITVAGAFTKIVSAFVNLATDFISWGLNQVISLLEILFSVVAPRVMPYIANAKAAFTTILKNPIAFVGNLVRAGKLGFETFASNILTHLKTALIKWITGPLGHAGVYIPKSFDLMEIIKLVLSVLGLTWQNIRGKLVKIIPEPVLVGLEKTAGILVTLVKEGPAAAWQEIKAELSELKDQLIAQVTQMISTEVVKAAIMKLVSMLNPAGAVVQAIIAIYNTISFFIQKIEQIADVVASFIDSIAAIAAGQVTSAAKKVEQTMANTLTMIIAFLAKFAGLGNIPEKVVGIVKKIRQPIDKGLDKIVAWLGGMLKKAAGAVLQAGLPEDPNERLRLGLSAAVSAVNSLRGSAVTVALVNPVLAGIRVRYGFRILLPFEADGKWWIEGEINPKKREVTQKEAGSATEIPISMTIPQAVKAIRGGSSQVAVRTEADARHVVSQTFPEAMERPGASVGSAYGSGDIARLIDQFRVDRQKLIVFHVDTRKYKVSEILPAMRAEIAVKEAAIEAAEKARDFIVSEMIERQARYTASRPAGTRRDFTERIATLNLRIEELAGHKRNLQDSERSFERNLSQYVKLEAEGVLYGHETVEASHPHRTRPHINVEGNAHKVKGQTVERVNIDVTIYIGGT